MNYGILTIVGQFGAGKTKNAFKYAFNKKQVLKDNLIIISNMPYDFVDMYFNSEDDFEKVCKYLARFMDETNTFDLLKLNKFKQILIVVDEFHLYMDSREFAKNFGTEGKITFTQCRKRDIEFLLLNQHFSQGDKRTRVLSKYIRKFYKLLCFNRYKDYELKKDDSSDLKDETIAEQIGRGLCMPDGLSRIFNPMMNKFFAQKFLSKFVVGFDNVFNLDYNDFKKYLRKNEFDNQTIGISPNEQTNEVGL